MTTQVEVRPEYEQWLRSYDTGVSSKAMFSAITGITTGDVDRPYDMADVGRCVRMLRALPELRPHIGKVAARHKMWIPFIDCWKELERGYDECVKWEALQPDEKRKQARRKHFQSPLDRYWQIMRELGCASQYLTGMRIQNRSGSYRNAPPETF